MAEAATPTAEAAEHVRPEDPAPSWDSMLPADPDVRREAFRELYHRREKQKDDTDTAKLTWNVAGAKKTLLKSHGWHKLVVDLAVKGAETSPEERAKIARQCRLLFADENWDPQRDLFDLAAVGKTTAPDDAPAFDQTRSGETHAAERGDDPGRARKRRANGQAPAAPDTGSIPLSEAEKVFGDNAKKHLNDPPTPDELDAIPEGAERRPGRVRPKKPDPGLAGAEGQGSYTLN